MVRGKVKSGPRTLKAKEKKSKGAEKGYCNTIGHFICVHMGLRHHHSEFRAPVHTQRPPLATIRTPTIPFLFQKKTKLYICLQIQPGDGTTSRLFLEKKKALTY